MKRLQHEKSVPIEECNKSKVQHWKCAARKNNATTQLAFTCSKSAKKTSEQCVKSVQS